MERILAINPGATSTKIAVFDSETVIFEKNIEHHGQELAEFDRIVEQYDYRLRLILVTLAGQNIAVDSIDSVVGRGGLLKPLQGGTYRVNPSMLEDLKAAKRGEHASNLGALLAQGIADIYGVPAYIVDPVSVDEMNDEARISGMPDLPRVSMSHALNSKSVAKKVAEEKGIPYDEMNLVVVHLGTGISVSAHHKGRMIDVNNAQEEGPFSPDRCGTVPARSLVKLCYSGKFTENEMLKKISGSGGIYSYLGTKDIREVDRMVSEGNDLAERVLKALPYQVGKEIGAMATVLKGNVDYIILTGGMAYSQGIVEAIKERVRYIAPIIVVPGEKELESLSAGVLRVMRQKEAPRQYE